MPYSINQIIENPELLRDESWGFYDWFCNENSLENKARYLLKKVKILVKLGVINGDKYTVWFKNNSNGFGLYDDFRINRLSDDEYVGCICPATIEKYAENKTSIYLLKSGSITEKSFKNWSTMKKELKENEELRDLIKSYMG